MFCVNTFIKGRCTVLKIDSCTVKYMSSTINKDVIIILFVAHTQTFTIIRIMPALLWRLK